MPTAAEVPPIEVGHQEFLSELNPFGIKGCGEGGAVAAPQVNVNRVPLSPAALLELIRAAEDCGNGSSSTQGEGRR